MPFPRATHLGLRTKLVILVILGIITASAIIGTYRVYQEKNRVISDIAKHGQVQADLIAEAVATLIVGFDYGNMELFSDRIIRQADVQSIVIRNRSGRIMVARAGILKPADAGSVFTSDVVFGGDKVGTVELRISLEQLRQTLALTYRQIVLEQVFFGIFLGLLIYLATSMTIVRPVNRLRDLTAELISRTSGSAPIRERRHGDEIQQLTDMFHEMHDKVLRSQKDLQQKVSLADTALVKANRSLVHRTEELETRTLELEKALAMVRELATTDALTGLPNRRYFDEQFGRSVSRALRFQEPLCLMLIDIDRFKEINDTLGHDAGDAALKEMGALLQKRVRDTDIAARLGGDEFAILLYRADAESATLFANSLLELCRSTSWSFRDQPVTLTLSIGVAHLNDGFTTANSLYRAADKALYRAKELGRDRFATFASMPLAE